MIFKSFVLRIPAKLAVICSLALITSGCEIPSFGKSKKNPLEGAATVTTFHEGQQAYMDGEYATSSRKMGVYAESYPNTVRGIEARYWQGMSLLELGNSRQARSMLEKVENNKNAPVSLKALSMRGIAKSYEAEKNHVKAESYYNNLLIHYPKDCDGAEILSALSECAKARGDIESSQRYISELRKKYPNSPYLAKKTVSAKSPVSSGLTLGKGKSGLYRVQIGVFSERNRALRMLEKLHMRKIESVVIHKGNLFVVQAGSFSTRDRAEKQVQKIKRLGFNAIIK